MLQEEPAAISKRADGGATHFAPKYNRDITVTYIQMPDEWLNSGLAPAAHCRMHCGCPQPRSAGRGTRPSPTPSCYVYPSPVYTHSGVCGPAGARSQATSHLGRRLGIA